MPTLDINNKYLNTPDGFELQIEDQNPATCFDEINGDKTINVELPINDNNRAILDNPDRFEKMGSVDDRRFEGANIRHGGQIIHCGTLAIEETDGKYSGWVRGAIGNLAEKVANLYVNQGTLKGTNFFENKSSYDPDSDDYACPKIFNRDFWSGKGKKIQSEITVTDLEGNGHTTDDEDYQLVLQHLDAFDFFVNFPETGGVATGGTNLPAAVSPMLFLWRAVELMFSDYNIFVKENFLKEDGNLKRLLIYNNYGIAKQQLTTVAQLISPYVYDEHVTTEIQVDAISNVTWYSTYVAYKDLLPKVSWGDWLLGIQNMLNVVFSFNDQNECRIVDRQQLLTATAFDIDEYMVGGWRLGNRKNVTLKLSMDHDGNDAAFSDNWQDLSDIRGNIKEQVQQFSDLAGLSPDLDEIRKVEADGNYYQYHWHTITSSTDDGEEEVDILGWEKITIGFQPYFHNDNKDLDTEEIKTCFSTLRQSENGYPLVQQPCSSAAFKTLPEDFSPRLIFYNGDESAGYRTSSMSLDFDGETGLAKTRWNYWLPFWANRLPAKGAFKFPAPVFHYIKNNKAILPLRTRHGSFIIDKITAVAGKSELITAELEVFKRESIVDYEEGTAPGSGGVSVPGFTPSYLGLTETGKPYLVNNLGDIRTPPSWGTLSASEFAKSTCIDYDQENKMLFVGAYNGTLSITDLSDTENITRKSIQIFPSGTVSAVRYLNGKILIGKDSGNKVYSQPYFSELSAYDDGQASEGSLDGGYVAKDFLYHDGYYYSCSKAGEVHRTTDPSGSWAQLFDVKADFRKAVATGNKLMVFGKDDDHGDDRAFSAPKPSPTDWEEFDIETTQGIYVSDAVDFGDDRALVVTNKEYGGLKIISSDNTATYFTPPLAQTCGGVCAKNTNTPVVALQEPSGGAKIAIHSGTSWYYRNVPAFFTKMFAY